MTRNPKLARFGKGKRLAKRMEWIAEQVEGEDVLDVGCIGNLLNEETPENLLHFQIKKHSKSVLGIDVNREGVSVARGFGLNVKFADAERFVSNPDKFDAVVFGACLEHMWNPVAAIRCAHQSLQDGGKIVITTPNARHLGLALKEKVAHDHNYIWTPEMLRRLVERHGFKVIETKFFKGQGKPNVIGWLYENIFMRLFPMFSMHFGIVAEKV